jgi:hypothetical protein
MKAHPFMWAKDAKIRDWAEVVRPTACDTLGGKAGICTLATSGAALAADEIRWVSGTDPITKKAVDIVFRRKPSGFKDVKGAAWDFCEGVVLLGRDAGYDPTFTFTKEHFDQAHDAMRPLYDKFRHFDGGWGEAEAAFGSIDLKPTDGGVPLRVQRSVNKYCPPLSPGSGNSPQARWTERLGKAWAKPEVRGAVICGAVAAVAIGTYIAARRYQQKRNEQQSETLSR